MNHRRTARGRLAAIAVVVATTFGLAACDAGPRTPEGTRTDMPQTATKTGDGTERRDLAPLTSRIPTLEGVQDATWYSGTLGSSDAPGPSLYWIDAVVTLPPGTADELRNTLDLAPATDAPDVVDALAPAVPDGDLLMGEQLDAAFSYQGWHSTAYLSASGDQLVLGVVGE
ncbi:hypothetical protein [Actinotalea subterranea]|uniref:hypothetical protein n=1 Tax=Actinotalea subterranea TaxID=2607497 RepID=UPI0011EEBC78|nr:hypothetical protein [Actinotalea subterranea]